MCVTLDFCFGSCYTFILFFFLHHFYCLTDFIVYFLSLSSPVVIHEHMKSSESHDRLQPCEPYFTLNGKRSKMAEFSDQNRHICAKFHKTEWKNMLPMFLYAVVLEMTFSCHVTQSVNDQTLTSYEKTNKKNITCTNKFH